MGLILGLGSLQLCQSLVNELYQILSKLYHRVLQFTKKYTAGCANLQKMYTAGYATFIHKDLHSKITETACVSMLALKINYNFGSAF